MSTPPAPRLILEPPVVHDLALIVEQARTMTIANDEQYRYVAETLLGVKDMRAKIASVFDDNIRRADQLHKALLKEKREAEASAVEAERILKALLVTWDDQQARLTADARAAHEAERREQDAITLAEAINAENAGDFARGDELRASLHVTLPLAVQPSPKVEGVSFRETWSAKVVDLAALVKAAAAHTPWIAFLNPNMAALNAQARSLKSRMAIPGVEAICVKGVASSRPIPPRRDQVTD